MNGIMKFLESRAKDELSYLKKLFFAKEAGRGRKKWREKKKKINNGAPRGISRDNPIRLNLQAS